MEKEFCNELIFSNTKVSGDNGYYVSCEDGEITKNVILLFSNRNRTGEVGKDFYIFDESLILIIDYDISNFNNEIYKNEFVDIERILNDKKEFNKIFKCLNTKEKREVKTFLNNYLVTYIYLKKGNK